MNKIRRKNLQTIIDRLEDIKADLITTAME